jgi:hypothetical protein
MAMDCITQHALVFRGAAMMSMRRSLQTDRQPPAGVDECRISIHCFINQP